MIGLTVLSAAVALLLLATGGVLSWAFFAPSRAQRHPFRTVLDLTYERDRRAFNSLAKVRRRQAKARARASK